MKGYLCYSSRFSVHNNDIETTEDLALMNGYRDWLFGEFSMPVEQNDVLRIASYHGYDRTPLEAWKQAEKCLRKAVSTQAKQYFRSMVEKYKNKTLYSV